MEEVIENNIEDLPIETFFKTLNELKKKDGNKYDFIIRGGGSLLNAFFNLFQIVWRKEKIPEEWRESSLTQILKGKTNTGVLDEIRHIQNTWGKNCIYKYFSQILMSFAKQILFQNMSKFQIASNLDIDPQNTFL